MPLIEPRCGVEKKYFLFLFFVLMRIMYIFAPRLVVLVFNCTAFE